MRATEADSETFKRARVIALSNVIWQPKIPLQLENTQARKRAAQRRLTYRRVITDGLRALTCGSNETHCINPTSTPLKRYEEVSEFV